MSIHLKTAIAPFIQMNYTFDRNWLLIFHQNASVGLYDKPEKAIFNLKDGMFSILSEINEDWKINGKFEFMLDYPELMKRNIWRQSLNPIDDYEEARPNEKTAVGYEGISIDMPEIGWGGLVRSSMSVSLLDGSVNFIVGNSNYWHYSIGTCHSDRIGIPANANSVNNSYLWIRYNSLKFIPHFEQNKFTFLRGAVLMIPYRN